MSPLCRQRWGHIVLLSPLSLSESVLWVCLPFIYLQRFLSSLSLSESVLWVCLPFISLQRFLSCRRSNTIRWPNAGLMLANLLLRWPNISPVLGYRVVFGATLNVGQRHRRRADNTSFGSKHVPVLPACRYLHHEVLTRTEWIVASTGDAFFTKKLDPSSYVSPSEEVGTWCFTCVRSVCGSLSVNAPFISVQRSIVQAVKQATLTQCQTNVSPPSSTLTQH